MWGNFFGSLVSFVVYCYLFLWRVLAFQLYVLHDKLTPSLYALSTFLVIFHLFDFIEQIIFPLTYCLTRRLKLLGFRKSQVNQKYLCQKLLRLFTYFRHFLFLWFGKFNTASEFCHFDQHVLQ
jgi:hypothetical protein